ncbi:DUF2057 family protein [Vibrio hippocampi]|uniref:UPF0319 protein VHP8226_03990 n=1 Tax=Vibrio hippocampi TaxID=654686 RepID=A0ABN8DLK2_9VIBR|nr:DUF2057 family protein [Vibrio hippocampi]CAH0530347.1 hypothetical protein VHP8226_03990 [Vibrio hippocampi]
MKALKIVTCALIAGFSTMAAAEVTLKTNDLIDVLAINAAKPNVTSGGLFTSGKTITMPDGVNQMVFKYQPYFDSGRDERATVSSETIIARFEASDVELMIDVPKYKNAREAEANIKTMTWSLKDKAGNTIPVVVDVLSKDGVQLGRDYSREAEDYNRMGGVAAIAPLGATVAVTAAPVVATTATVATAPVASNAPAAGNTAEEMLMFWYNKADDQTKARFKQYVNQQ